MQSAAGFYDRIAASYDDEMRDPRTALLRQAFWDVVERYAPPDRSILDFGCGTGVDAACYASRGFRVLAYDVSPRMIDRLTERCAREPAAGNVVAVLGPESLKEQLTRFDDIGTLTLNFAVLNLLDGLDEFSRFVQEELRALDTIVVSVQNPFFLRDMLQGWWWKGLLRSPHRGSIDYSAAEMPTRRHFISRIKTAVGPGFAIRHQVSVVWGRIRRRFPLNRAGHMRILVFTRD